jgi:putative transposase
MGGRATFVDRKGITVAASCTARLMVFKLVMAAARTWRRLKGQNQLPKLIAGARFQDGIEVIETKPQSAA